MFPFLMGLALLQSCACSNNLPVLIMDHDNVMTHTGLDPSPFEAISADLFTELILDAVKRTDCVIIFAEESLCTEDISLKDKHGTPFYHLQKGISKNRALYLPSVSEPYNLLRQIFEPKPSNTYYLGFGEQLQLSNEYYKHMYVYFQDVPIKSRADVLRKHDLIMREVYSIVRQLKAGPVVAFYTGKLNPVTVERFATPDEEEEEIRNRERGVMIVTPDALFRLYGAYSTLITGYSPLDQMPDVEMEMRTRRTLNTTMQYAEFNLQFNFEFEEKIWRLGSISLLEGIDEVGRTETSVSAPWDRSYYCGEPITVFNKRDGSYITLSEYQIEPLSESRRMNGRRNILNAEDKVDATSENTTNRGNDTIYDDLGPPSMSKGKCSFSKSLNCGPYFNTYILEALFVFMIFLLITTWGALMLLNCGTNSRFDNPNQKPLVIAQEPLGG